MNKPFCFYCGATLILAMALPVKAQSAKSITAEFGGAAENQAESLQTKEFSRQLANGRLNNRLTQDIELLRKMTELIKRLEDLRNHPELLELLPSESANRDYLRRAMQRISLPQPSRPSSTPSEHDFRGHRHPHPPEDGGQAGVEVTAEVEPETMPRVALIRQATATRQAEIVLEHKANFRTIVMGSTVNMAGRLWQLSSVNSVTAVFKAQDRTEDELLLRLEATL